MTVFRRVALCVLLSCLVVAVARAQPEAPLPVPAERKKALLEGTHVFRRILHDNDCRSLKSFDELTEEPAKSILILFGDLDRITEVPDGLAKFVEDGGAVLLASDRPLTNARAARQLRAVAGVTISEATLVLHFDGEGVLPRTRYNQLLYCPILQAERLASPDLLRADGRAGPPLAVATNVPAYLVGQRLPAGIGLLANLPANCTTAEEVGGGRMLLFRDPLPFLVGGDVGAGRILVAADHSVFINEMMLPDDTNNVEFSENCVRYLIGKGGRDRVLLIDEFGVQTKFDVPLKSANIPLDEMLGLLIEKRNHIIKAGEDGLVRLERNNAFNNAANRVLQRIDDPPGRLFAVIATLATIVLLIVGMVRLGVLGRFSHDGKAAPLAQAVAATQPGTPLVQQRTFALLRTGVMNEPAGQLARRWLLSQGIAPPGEVPGEVPAVVKGGWWAGRSLRRRLARVWRLASGKAREAITPAALWALQRELDALAGSRLRGEWVPQRMKDEG